MTLRTRWADSYRMRLILGYVLVVSVLAGAWAWSLYGPLTDAVIEQQQAHLQSVAQAGVLVVARTPGVPEQTVRELVARTDLRMTLVAADGTVLADSARPGGDGNHADRPEIVTALAGEVGRDVRRSATQGVEQMYVAVPPPTVASEWHSGCRNRSRRPRAFGEGPRDRAALARTLGRPRARPRHANRNQHRAPRRALADAACAMAAGGPHIGCAGRDRSSRAVVGRTHRAPHADA